MPATNDLVLRSFYLSALEDSQLRQYAFQIGKSKSDLVRAAITSKLRKWNEDNDLDAILRDIDVTAPQTAFENDDHVERHLVETPATRTSGLRPAKKSRTKSAPAQDLAATSAPPPASENSIAF